MATYNEYLENRKRGIATQQQTDAPGSFAAYLTQRRANRWAQSVDSFISNTKDAYKSRENRYNSSDSILQYRDSLKDELQNLLNDASYAERYANQIEDAAEKESYLNEVRRTKDYLNALPSELTKEADYWSRWKTEDEYNLWKAAAEKTAMQEAMTAEDVQAKIADLEKQKENLKGDQSLVEKILQPFVGFTEDYRVDGVGQSNASKIEDIEKELEEYRTLGYYKSRDAMYSQLTDDEKQGLSYILENQSRLSDMEWALGQDDRGSSSSKYKQQMSTQIQEMRDKISSAREKISARGLDPDTILEYHARIKNAENREAEQAKNKDFYENHPFWSNVASVAATFLKPVGMLGTAEHTLSQIGSNDYIPLDINDSAFLPSRFQSDIRGSTSADIDNGFANFLYQTGMSMADFIASSPLGGVGASIILGGGAGTDTVISAVERGATNNQALFSGLLAGAAEMIFEKFSLDNLIKIKDTKRLKDLFVNVLKQAGIEGSEEVATEISNFITDNLIMGDKSQYQLDIKNYIMQGMSQEEAKKQAGINVAKQIGLAFAGGALSGGILGGVTSGTQLVGNKLNDYRNIEILRKAADDVAGVSTNGTAMPNTSTEYVKSAPFNDSGANNTTMRQNTINWNAEPNAALRAKATVSGEASPVELRGIDDVTDGKVNVRLQDGRSVPLSDVNFENPAIYSVYEAAAAYETGTAKAFVAGYTTDLPLSAYQAAFELIHDDAMRGVPMEEAVLKTGEAGQMMGLKAQYMAYSSGVNQAKALQNAAENDTIDVTNTNIGGVQNGAEGVSNIRGNGIYFDGQSGEQYTAEASNGEKKIREVNQDGEETVYIRQHQGSAGGSDGRGNSRNSQQPGVSGETVETDKRSGRISITVPQGAGSGQLEFDSVKPEHYSQKQKRDSDIGASYGYAVHYVPRGSVLSFGDESMVMNRVAFVIPGMNDIFVMDGIKNDYIHHELFHQFLGNGNPKAKEVFQSVSVNAMKHSAAYVAYNDICERQYGQDVSAAAVYEEIACDLCEYAMSGSEKMRSRLEGLFEPGVLEKLAKQARSVFESSRSVSVEPDFSKKYKRGVTREYTDKNITPVQKKQIEILDAYGKAHGLSFVFVDTLKDGMANGMYKNGVIYIAMDAQEHGYLVTAGHEVFHYLEKTAPSQTAVLREYVLSQLKKSMGEEGYNALVQERMRQYQTDDAAYAESEIAANGMFDVFKNPKTIENLTKTNRLLALKVRTALTNFASELRKIIARMVYGDGNTKGRYAEVRALQQNFEALDRIAALFDDALNGRKNAAFESDTYKQENESRYSFAGPNAKTANISTLNDAKARISNGEESEAVRQETGWFKGYDGKWRFEIDDSKAEFRPEGDVRLMQDESYRRLQELTDKWVDDNLTEAETEEMDWLSEQFSDKVWEEKYRLDDYLDHPDLYDAYPMLRYTSLVFDDLPPGEKGFFNPRSNTIVLSRDLFGKQKNTLLHEIQHIIQKYEGFAKGSSPKYWNDRMESGYSKRDENGIELMPSELYKATAGEIEARDTASRADMTSEQRKSTRPDIDRTDVVFADGESVSYLSAESNNTSSIKQQIKDHLNEINEMDSVADISYTKGSKHELKQRAIKEFKSIGFQIDRKGFGVIEIGERQINDSLNYLNNDGEYAALLAVPKVLKRGKNISGHDNHKGRSFGSITIAAPVTINGITGDMAVVVKQTGKNRYYAHRILMPDGSEFVFKEIKKAEPTSADMLDYSVDQGTAIGSASDTTVPQKAPSVNTSISADGEKYSLKTVDVDADGNDITDAQQAFFSRSAVRDENGKLKVMYHATDADFTVFDKSKQGTKTDAGVWGSGFYFDSNQEFAEEFGNQSKAYYLNVTNPFQTTYDADCHVVAGMFKRAGIDIPFTISPDMSLLRFIKRFGNQKFSEALRSLGYDGVIVSGEECVIYEPNQAKLTSNQNPTKDVDVRYQLSDTESLIEKYGAIPTGEKPSRDIKVPKQTSDELKTRRFVRTVLESKHLTDEMVENVNSEIVKEALSYAPVSDKASMDYARNIVKTDMNSAWRRWNAVADGSAVAGKNDIAIGEALLIAAAENGKTKDVMQMISDLSVEATRAGQTVQAFSLLKKMTGIGKLQYVARCVDKINADLEPRIQKGKARKVVLDDALAMALADAKSPEAAENAVNDILYDVAQQMPVTWLDKWNAWRYLSMLANPRTHGRNILGNVAFVPALRLKSAIAAGLENVLVKDGEKTSSLKASEENKAFAKKDYEVVSDVITGGGKLNASDKVRDMQRVFKTEWLETIRKFNSWALEKEDAWFLQRHYVYALSHWMQANNYTPENIDEKSLNRARLYAINEAQKATYRDASAAAKAIKNAAKVPGLGVVVEGIMPFTKTPINILKRGIDYSPVGLLKALSYGTYQLKTGKITINEYIDGIAAGLSGSTITVLGVVLYNLGLLVGGFDDDREDELKALTGEQEYAIRIGDTSYTISWLTPISMPLFVGAEIAKLFDREYEGTTAKDWMSSLLSITEPMFNLSMLDGFNQVVQRTAYSENPMTTILTESALSYVSQAVPTALGQVARTIDDTRRSTYVDKNSKVPKDVQYAWQKIRNKLPGLSFLSQPYVDNWGNTDKQTNVALRAFENFISPGYISEVSADNVESALSGLYDATGENAVLPTRQAKYFNVDGERIDLTGEQYTTAQTVRGQTAYAILSDMMGSDAYRQLSNDGKAQAVKDAYAFANAVAKSGVSDYQLTGWMNGAYNLNKASGVSVGNIILSRALDADQTEKKEDSANFTYRPSDISLVLDAGGSSVAQTALDTILDEAESAYGLLSKAEQEKVVNAKISSVKSSVTSKYKKLFLDAYIRKDDKEMQRIRLLLLALKANGKPLYRSDDLTGWITAYKKEQQTK